MGKRAARAVAAVLASLVLTACSGSSAHSNAQRAARERRTALAKFAPQATVACRHYAATVEGTHAVGAKVLGTAADAVWNADHQTMSRSPWSRVDAHEMVYLCDLVTSVKCQRFGPATSSFQMLTDAAGRSAPAVPGGGVAHPRCA